MRGRYDRRLPVGKDGEGTVWLVGLLLVHGYAPEVIVEKLVEPQLEWKVGPDVLVQRLDVKKNIFFHKWKKIALGMFIYATYIQRFDAAFKSGIPQVFELIYEYCNEDLQ